MSQITLWWHMIIRGHTHEALQALESLQGLYDGMVIAVDDRNDSDEVFGAIQHYPNIYAYRQNFARLGRYDLARQDALDRIPIKNPYTEESINYIGWSDSDELLASDPYEIRKWLSETQPEAVNCGIYYSYAVGGHQAGQTYRNGRVRIWKASTRIWCRPCHEYPAPINGIDNPVMGDIIFNHIKQDNKEYRADHHIELMQKEIDSGSVGWLFYQAKEYEFKYDIDGAKKTYFKYLQSGDTNNFDEAISKFCNFYLTNKEYDDLIKKLIELKIPHPLVCEYLAIAYYWKNDLVSACISHEEAKKLDKENKYSHIKDNDNYFLKN